MPTITRWTGHDFCALQQALGLTNERFAERVKVAVRTIANWRTRGHDVLPDLAQRVLPAALDDAPASTQERFAAIRQKGSRHADAIDNTIGAAADEVDTERLTLAEPDAASVTSLWTDIRSLAHAGNRPPFETFSAAHRIRRHAQALAERTRHPAVLADLYVIIGQATALMASTAFDLHRWRAADTLVKSARECADMAGDPALHAWVLGLDATLANWRNEPDTAISLFRRGIQLAPTGAPKFRLRHIASRSYALLGDVSSLRNVLKKAEDDLDDARGGYDILSQDMGGEFAFGDARAAACRAAAWLDAEQGIEAEAEAQQSLAELLSLPRPRRPFSQIAGVRIDIANARLLAGDTSGAGEALTTVLTIPEHTRNVSLAGRMARIRDTLNTMTKTEATQLRESVDQWLTDADAIRAQHLVSLPQ